MSILIHGKMPKYGDCVVIFSDGNVRTFKAGLVVFTGREFEAENKAIELPPHGRLIDADALWEKEKSERALKKHRPKDQSIIFDAGFLAGFRAAAQIASKMPTILPADPEGGADG